MIKVSIIVIAIYVLLKIFSNKIENYFEYSLSGEKKVQQYISTHFHEYDDVREEVHKIINNGLQNKLMKYKSQINKTFFSTDSLYIFNPSRNKFYTTLNSINSINASGSSDLVQGLYGVKIQDQWYIFFGGNLIAMRGGYKYDKYEPFTWDEISFMAHEQMFGKYLSFDWKGKLSINHELIDKEVNPWDLGGTSVSEEGTETERFLRIWEFKNSQIIDSLQIAQIKEDLEAGKNKPKDPIKKVTWWNKLWGEEVPIFETDEWKEYIKSKNQRK
ncbi:MAG: hypothetical protein IPN86_18320 [Saprospiraceae bacterium]|nr:hypothetical protein [Saprospiraceae bacterium]